MPHSAGGRVAGIPELLEHILLEFKPDTPTRSEQRETMRTLLRAQQVSNSFRDTIIGSAKLQRELYFVPCDAPHQPGSFNPLISALYVETPEGIVARLNRICPGTGHCGTAQVVFRESGARTTLAETREGFPLAIESWRKMFIWRTRHEVVRVSTENPVHEREVSLVNPTAGEVYDAIFKPDSPVPPSQSMIARSYHGMFIPV